MTRALKLKESKRIKGVFCPYSDPHLELERLCKFSGPGKYHLTIQDLNDLVEYGEILEESLRGDDDQPDPSSVEPADNVDGATHIGKYVSIQFYILLTFFFF